MVPFRTNFSLYFAKIFYLDKLIAVLKTAVGQFANRQLLVESPLGGDDGCVRRQWEVDSWVWDQVRLELV